MRRDMRRSQHDKIEAPNVAKCPSCGEPRLSHRACKCGYYGGNKNREGAKYDSLMFVD